MNDEQETKLAFARSRSNGGLAENALNEACWAFLDGWNLHTDQKMSGNTWNNLKPMVRIAVMKYMAETANVEIRGG